MRRRLLSRSRTLNMIREESKMPWVVFGLQDGCRRLGPILVTAGLLLVICCGHDVNTTMTSSSQNVTSRTNSMGLDAGHEGILRQENRSMLIPTSSRERKSNTPKTEKTSHQGKKRGGSTSNADSSTAAHQNIRHNKQRRRGKNRGKGRGGKGKGKHRHKGRSKAGDNVSQHTHIRRNLEKQVLVQNRTLELLGGGGARILWASNGGNNTTQPVTSELSYHKNDSNSTVVPSNLTYLHGSRENSSADYIFTRLPMSNVSSPETVVERNERTHKSRIPSISTIVSSSIKAVGNRTESLGNVTSEYSERSRSAIDNFTRSVTVTDVSDERTGGFAVPVRFSAGDEIVVADYQYDYDAIETPGVVESSVWFSPRRDESRNEDNARANGRSISSSSGGLEPGPLQAALGTTLARVLSVLTDQGGSGDVNKDEEEDPCERWMRCKDKLQKAFLGPLGTLPSCPCHYPSAIFYDDKIWDKGQGKYFRWRDVSGEAERLDVYKPGAAYCIRSLLAQGSASLAAQHCCYDRYRRLLTRGSGAGTPDFVSPEVSSLLHEKVDILPWKLCKGDFTRYNTVRPPNNDNNCTANPDEEEFLQQVLLAQYF